MVLMAFLAILIKSMVLYKEHCSTVQSRCDHSEIVLVVNTRVPLVQPFQSLLS